MCVFVFDLDLGRRHFRGQAAVEAAVTSLVREHGLGSHPGHTLVFGGDSAGGIGSMLHIDAMPALLDRLGAAASVRLLGLADSSYLIDDGCGIDSLGMLHGHPLPRPGGAGRPGEVPQVVWPDGCRMNVPTRSGLADDVSPGHFPGYSGYVQGLLQLANVDDDDGSFLSRECLRRYRRGTSSGGGGGGGSGVDEGWKCGLAQYQMPFVRARYLMVSSMADSYQLTSNLGHRPATDLELEYARRFALRSSDAARELLLPDGYGGGDHGGDGPSMVFMQNCYSHGAILPRSAAGARGGGAGESAAATATAAAAAAAAGEIRRTNISGWSVADTLAAFVGVGDSAWPRNRGRRLPPRGLFDDPVSGFAAGPGCA